MLLEDEARVVWWRCCMDAKSGSRVVSCDFTPDISSITHLLVFPYAELEKLGARLQAAGSLAGVHGGGVGDGKMSPDRWSAFAARDGSWVLQQQGHSVAERDAARSRESRMQTMVGKMELK